MKTPDIEIYLKHTHSDLITKWLSHTFTALDVPTLSQENFSNGMIIKGHLMLDKVTIPVMITPHAVGKSFCSIWFKSENTPWINDEACALDFLSHLDGDMEVEVRCSSGSWRETEEIDHEQWLCITQNEKKLIHWR